jgi:hypothetical protein
VVINYSNFTSTSSDWIAIATPASADTAYTAFQYTGGHLSGSLTFSGLANGTYEARGYFNNNYTRMATSMTFTVGP